MQFVFLLQMKTLLVLLWLYTVQHWSQNGKITVQHHKCEWQNRNAVTTPFKYWGRALCCFVHFAFCNYVSLFCETIWIVYKWKTELQKTLSFTSLSSKAAKSHPLSEYTCRRTNSFVDTFCPSGEARTFPGEQAAHLEDQNEEEIKENFEEKWEELKKNEERLRKLSYLAQLGVGMAVALFCPHLLEDLWL